MTCHQWRDLAPTLQRCTLCRAVCQRDHRGRIEIYCSTVGDVADEHVAKVLRIPMVVSK